MLKNKWKTISVCSLMLLLNSGMLLAQSLQSWINFNQSYYKIKTGQDGIYRISYSDLQQAGFPVEQVDPRRIQLFHRGVEQAIFVEGQLDARFDPQDFIEFYGKRNDGTLDAYLYVSEEAQPHTYYNLYSDSTAFFLTWSLTQNGRRMNSYTENNVENLPAETGLNKTVIQILHQNYSAGRHYPLGSRSAETFKTEFDFGEGWTGPSIRKGNTQTFELNLPSTNTSADGPVLDLVLVGRNNLRHRAEIFAGPSSVALRSMGTLEWNHHDQAYFSSQLQWSDIAANGNLFIRVLSRGYEDNDPDFMSVSLVKVNYISLPNQNNSTYFTFETQANSQGKSYLEIQNAPVNARMYDITDPNDPISIGINRPGSSINAILQNSFSPRQIAIISEVLQADVPEFTPMRNIQPENHNFLIVTHPRLRQPAGNFSDPVQAYAAYRASPAGGSYDTLIIEIDQLYNQFSYGETSSLAIYNFLKYMAEADHERRYVLIIGKGLTPNYNSHRSIPATEVIQDLVPTGGFPGNDMVFSTHIRGSGFVPWFSTGRLSATNPAMVAGYLNKVIEMENLPFTELWRKELVHLSGGRGVTEQTIFRNYVDQFKAVAVEPFLGGRVTTQSKRTNNSTELINISDEVNQGKSMITFFGHSGTTGTDIEIGYASNDGLGYRNKGKYPVILVNGCNAGDTFFRGFGFGEDWISTPERGAIGFIAHSSQGLSIYLKRYTDIFYATAFADSMFINRTVGEIQQEVARRYLQIFPETALHTTQVQQMTLQGDPAVKIFGADLPDYGLSEDRVFIKSRDGGPVNAFSESFNLGIVVQNTGKATRDSINITIRRTLSNGQTENLPTEKFKAVFHQDTIFIEIEGRGQNSYGNNQFEIVLSIDEGKEELNLQNNRIVFNYFMPLGGLISMYPYNYAIVNRKEIPLYSQSLNLLTGSRIHELEIDTSKFFNSPARQQTSFQAKALGRWDVNLFQNLPQKDSTVFYWRSRFGDPQTGEINTWDVQSFTFIENHPGGWSMSHFPQFEGTLTNGIVPDSDKRQWEFQKFTSELKVVTSGPVLGEATLEIKESPYIFQTRLCTPNTVNMVAFERSTTAPYLGIRFSQFDGLDRRMCGRIPNVINNFNNNEITGNQRLLEAYINAISEGDYILLFTIGEVLFENWPESTIQKLTEMGVDLTSLEDILNGHPIIILGIKGSAPGTATVIRSQNDNPLEDIIELHTQIEGNFLTGNISSPSLGPATSWGQLHYEISVPENYSEIPSINLIGIKPDNTEVRIKENIPPGTSPMDDIDPFQFPSLRIELEVKNKTGLMAPQLKKWLMSFDPTPEGILLPDFDISDQPMLLQEGEIKHQAFRFVNVSQKQFNDSIRVRNNIFNQNLIINQRDSFNIAAPAPDAYIPFTYELPTLNLEGLNNLTIIANPGLQKEYTFNNNRLDFTNHYNVETDKVSPLMEVTVDGRFILDGEIVSPRPRIFIRMKDENKVRLKTDTLGMEISMKKPCEGCLFERISFSKPELNWTPATEDADFSIEYRPEDLSDGLHNLRVMLSDASGNAIGPEPYTVSFEVINESTITNFYPYPNPFSNSVRFVFTLTGNDIPENFIIQIMTISGRIVREIRAEEIGPIRIGHNITKYAWDGKDEYGDQLANGVYLYRVQFDTRSDVPAHRAVQDDRGFKKGYGKLYLLR
jgi:hypothetical protein